jgi:hypothetical protein
MAFADLSERFDDALHLPINGKTYDIPSPDHETGLWVTALVATGWQVQQGIAPDPNRKVPQLHFEGQEGDDESDEGKLYQRLLGSAYAALRADGVSWAKIKFVSETVMIWVAAGEDMAEAHWNGGGRRDPKAQAEAQAKMEALQLERAPNRAARRRGTASTATGTASTTGKAGSTRGTTSRRATTSTRSPSPGK